MVVKKRVASSSTSPVVDAGTGGGEFDLLFGGLLEAMRLSRDPGADPDVLERLACHDQCPLPVLISLTMNDRLPEYAVTVVYKRLKTAGPNYDYVQDYFVKRVLDHPNCPAWILEYETLLMDADK